MPRIFPFNFQARFAPLVAQGLKLQTIRANRKDGRRPVVGDIARCYTGLRTSRTRWLFDGLVTRCRSVRMDLAHPAGEIVVDGELLTLVQRGEFAKADGFESWTAMHAWFADNHLVACFEGFCVEWVSTASGADRG